MTSTMAETAIFAVLLLVLLRVMASTQSLLFKLADVKKAHLRSLALRRDRIGRVSVELLDHWEPLGSKSLCGGEGLGSPTGTVLFF